MSSEETKLMLEGATLFGYIIAGLFFARFWEQTRERLFAWFAVAFFILALERVLLRMVINDGTPLVYLTRLIAFLLIIAAIWEKNRGRRR